MAVRTFDILSYFKVSECNSKCMKENFYRKRKIKINADVKCQQQQVSENDKVNIFMDTTVAASINLSVAAASYVQAYSLTR